jgi:hypothetical protein
VPRLILKNVILKGLLNGSGEKNCLVGMLLYWSLVTDISEELAVSIFRIQIKDWI